MHILIIPSEQFMTEISPLGGIFQMHQARALRDAGHKVGVVSVGVLSPRYLIRSYTYKREESIDGIKVLRSYKSFPFPYRWLSFDMINKLHIRLGLKIYMEYIKIYGEPDIIHAHNFLFAGLMAEAIRKEYGVNYLLTEHSSIFSSGEFFTNKKYLKRVAEKAIAVTAVSKAFSRLLEERAGLFGVEVLPNIVDKSFFQNCKHIRTGDTFIFLNIASVDKNKNQKLLIEAFASLFREKNVILKIVGGGPLLEDLKSLAIHLGIAEQVKFLGLLDQKQVIEEMGRADCFVLSSNYETFGVVLIEALACGLPLVATRSGGPEDIIDRDNGLLVNIGNRREMKKALWYMYENIDNYDPEKLRKQAKERFGDEVFVRNVMRYYKMRKYDDHDS